MDSTLFVRSPILLGLLALVCLLGIAAPARAQTVGCLWEKRSLAPIPRFEAGSLVVDDQLYIFGGYNTSAIEATTRSDRYDPVADQWTRIADLPTPVTHTPFVQAGRIVWALGGFVGDHPGVATADVWLYDIDQDVWTPGPALPRPIAAGAAILVGRVMHYVSGCEADRATMTADHWAYDLDAPALGWQPLSPMPLPRCHYGIAQLAGEIWAIGGQVGHDVNAVDVPYVHRYRPALDSWIAGPYLPRPRSHFEGATFTVDQRIYIGGGQNHTMGLANLSGMLELDSIASSWSYLPQLPFARQAACVRKIGGYIYAAGGAGPDTTPSDDLYRRRWNGHLPSPLRINCGGGEIAATTGSCCWCGDIGAENGTPLQYDQSTNVSGTNEDVVFHRQRGSSGTTPTDLDYRFPMGNGFFRVRVLLSDLDFAAPGQRILDLTIEGKRVIEDLDLAAQVGHGAALVRTFDVEVQDHVLNLHLAAGPMQQAVVAALEIERLDGDVFTHECTSQANSTGHPGTLDFVGNTSVADDDLTLLATDLPSGTFGLLIQSLEPGHHPIAGGIFCVTPPFYRLPPGPATGTDLHLRLEISNPPVMAQTITAGSTWHFQCWYRDAGVTAGYGLTDALMFAFTD